MLDATGPTKYIVCNADEGDSGTFADRMLMEGDPFTLLEGMIIAGWAVGANEGFIYVRSEYPDAIEALHAAIAAAEQCGWLGDSVLGSGFAFRMHVRVGAGAYICGEETAMLDSLEGKRGVVRAKPPLPALEGLFGKPTVVNNVLSLATVPAILADGAAAYAALGIGRSRGTQVFQLAGNIARGGIVETAFGITLGELVVDIGGGTASGRPLRAIQVGGPLGSYLPGDRLDLPMDYEAFAAADALLGHGGIVVFDDTVDMAAQARFRDGVLRRRVVRQVHPLSYRQHPWRGVDRQDRRRRRRPRRSSQRHHHTRRPLRSDGRRFSVCDGRPHTAAGAQRAHPLHRRFPPPDRSERMTLSMNVLSGLNGHADHGYVGDHDLGTPAPDRQLRQPAPATVEITIDDQTVLVPEGTSVIRAAALAGIDIPKLCARPTASSRSGPVACAWSRSTAAKARPRRARLPLRPACTSSPNLPSSSGCAAA